MESLFLSFPEGGPTLLLGGRNPFTSLGTEDPFLARSARAAGGCLTCTASSAASLLGRPADAPPHKRAHLRYLFFDLLFLRFQALQSSLKDFRVRCRGCFCHIP